jgi:hypothetical protein
MEVTSHIEEEARYTSDAIAYTPEVKSLLRRLAAKDVD